MFTGIIETLGVVRALRSSSSGVRLAVEATGLKDAPKAGASIAINGVCQTVVAGSAFPILEFDVVPETLRRTTLGALKPGDKVNIEQALRPTDRLDGHYVQGHVDGTAVIVEIRRDGGEWMTSFELKDSSLADFVIPKGSIAIDGVSLTVAEVRGGGFSVAMIPTTLSMTTLGQREVGDDVNIETDILARTVISHLRSQGGSSDARMTKEFLREHGFA